MNARAPGFFVRALGCALLCATCAVSHAGALSAATTGVRGANADRTLPPPGRRHARSMRPPKLPPQEILRRYAHALATLPRPRRISFQYRVEQFGLHNLEQVHRVYRAGARERDETVEADGTTLPVPAVRIFDNRTNRYDVLAVAPRPDAYDFTFVGTARRTYLFKTSAHAPAAFTVTGVEIEARTFLPAAVRFHIAGNGAGGTGELRYDRAERYWMVRQAQVTARVTGGGIARERIAWSNYQFPSALPPSTFQPPIGGVTPEPTTPG